MIFFDFNKNIYPKSEIPYFKSVISFVENWQNGVKNIKTKTSGSTGLPKNIKLKRENMVASAHITGQFFNLRKGDHLFCCLNINYIGGMMMLVRAIELKLQITVIEPVSNPLLLKENQKKYDFIALVPLQLNNIYENEVSKVYLKNLSKIKNIIVGGASINSNLEKYFNEINIPIFNTYGMTETVSHIAVRRINGAEKSEYFTLLPKVEIKLDKRNCLKIKAPSTGSKWLQTNDSVEIKSYNTFKFIGRADRVINSGGIKLNLDILEKKIEPIIKDIFEEYTRYFFFGINDDKLGQKLTLFIENENFTYQKKLIEIIEKSFTTKFEIPKNTYFLKKFKETENGKIDFFKTVTTNISS